MSKSFVKHAKCLSEPSLKSAPRLPAAQGNEGVRKLLFQNDIKENVLLADLFKEESKLDMSAAASCAAPRALPQSPVSSKRSRSEKWKESEAKRSCIDSDDLSSDLSSSDEPSADSGYFVSESEPWSESDSDIGEERVLGRKTAAKTLEAPVAKRLRTDDKIDITESRDLSSHSASDEESDENPDDEALLAALVAERANGIIPGVRNGLSDGEEEYICAGLQGCVLNEPFATKIVGANIVGANFD